MIDAGIDNGDLVVIKKQSFAEERDIAVALVDNQNTLKRFYRDNTNKKIILHLEFLPHFSCHNLRHTFCTRFCENETNLKVIQEIMGHADITTTMDVYNEATKDKK